MTLELLLCAACCRSHPVITGFTSGAALVIATGQVRCCCVLLSFRLDPQSAFTIVAADGHKAYVQSVQPCGMLMLGAPRGGCIFVHEDRSMSKRR